MIASIRNFVQVNAIAILAALLAIAVLFGAWQTVRIDGFGVWPLKVEGLADKAAKAAQLQVDLDTAKATAAKSEQLRTTERAQDTASYAAQSTTCDQRVTTARDAGQAIKEIVNAPTPLHPPADGSRAIVPADSLRRIIGQAGPGGATVVSDGSGSASQ